MIELKNVHKVYGNVEVGLYDESLTIYDGEVIGILGENGSGKTTMLKAIMGLIDIQSGEILVDGSPVVDQYERMAFITEEGSFFPSMTAYEYGGFLADFFPEFNIKRYNKLMKFFKLDPYKKIKKYSTGQKSKLEIVAGFSKGAKYILMDEPFMGNDIFARRDFLKLMISSLKSDETILITTHLIDEIENFIDRAVILRCGRIKADFYIDDMRNDAKTLEEVMMETVGYTKDRYKTLFDTEM